MQDDAEGKNVAAHVNRFAGHLLWRHVANRTHHHAGLSALRGSRVRAAVGILEKLGQSEIGQFRVAVFRHQNVLGLDVPMDDTGRVCSPETISDSDEEIDDLPRRPLFHVCPVSERASVEELRDEILTAFEFADVVNRQNVRVVERRCHMRFTLEPASRRRIKHDFFLLHLLQRIVLL